MDGMVAYRSLPNIERPHPHVRETLMSPEEVEAARLLHDEYSQLDITLISKPELAAGEIISALPELSPHENLLRKLAAELGREVLKHPDAQDGQLFTLHLRNVDIDSEDVLPTVGNSITRLVALPVGSTTSPRGNMMPDDVTAFCDDWAETANQDVLLFTAYPSFIEEAQLIDPEQERQILTEKQILRLRAIQGKMLAEAQAASMQSLEAQTALIGTLGHLRRMGTQLGAYRQVAKKSKSDDPNRKTELAQTSQSIRNESRALAASLKKDAMNGMLSPQLRETLRAGLKELRATGVLSEKHAPKIIATPRLKTATTSSLTKTPPTAKIIPLHKAAAQAGRPIVSKTTPTDTAILKGKAGLVSLTKADIKKGATTSLEAKGQPETASGKTASLSREGKIAAVAKDSKTTPVTDQGKGIIPSSVDGKKTPSAPVTKTVDGKASIGSLAIAQDKALAPDLPADGKAAPLKTGAKTENRAEAKPVATTETKGAAISGTSSEGKAAAPAAAQPTGKLAEATTKPTSEGKATAASPDGKATTSTAQSPSKGAEATATVASEGKAPSTPTSIKGADGQADAKSSVGTDQKGTPSSAAPEGKATSSSTQTTASTPEGKATPNTQAGVKAADGHNDAKTSGMADPKGTPTGTSPDGKTAPASSTAQPTTKTPDLGTTSTGAEGKAASSTAQTTPKAADAGTTAESRATPIAPTGAKPPESNVDKTTSNTNDAKGTPSGASSPESRTTASAFATEGKAADAAASARTSETSAFNTQGKAGTGTTAPDNATANSENAQRSTPSGTTIHAPAERSAATAAAAPQQAAPAHSSSDGQQQANFRDRGASNPETTDFTKAAPEGSPKAATSEGTTPNAQSGFDGQRRGQGYEQGAPTVSEATVNPRTGGMTGSSTSQDQVRPSTVTSSETQQAARGQGTHDASGANSTGAVNPTSQPAPPPYHPQAATTADKPPPQQSAGAAEPIVNNDRSNSSFSAPPPNTANNGAGNSSPAANSQNADPAPNNAGPALNGAAQNIPPPPNQPGKAADTASTQTGDTTQSGTAPNQQAKAEPIPTPEKPADPTPAKPVQPTEPTHREEDKINQPRQNETQPREEPKEPINQQYKEAAKEVGCPICGSTSCAGHDLGNAEAKDSKVVDFGFEDKDVQGQYKEAAKEIGCPICGSTSCAGHDLGKAEVAKDSKVVDFGFEDANVQGQYKEAAKEVGCPICGSTNCGGHDLGKADNKTSRTMDMGDDLMSAPDSSSKKAHTPHNHVHQGTARAQPNSDNNLNLG